MNSVADNLLSLRLRLAAMQSPVHWRASLLAIADRLDKGGSLEAALRNTNAMPGELKALCDQLHDLPDPGRLVLDVVEHRRQVYGHWRELLSLVSYPVVLLVASCVIGVAFSLVMKQFVDLSGIEQFGFVGFDDAVRVVDDNHAKLVGWALVVGWFVVVLLTVALAGPRWALSAVLGGLFLIGRPLRYLQLEEVLLRYSAFAGQQKLTDLHRRVADSFSQSSQCAVANSIARRMTLGSACGESFAASSLSDNLSRPILLLLDDESYGEQRFGRVAVIFGRLVESYCRILGSLLPVILFLLIGSLVWTTISSYLTVFSLILDAML